MHWCKPWGRAFQRVGPAAWRGLPPIVQSLEGGWDSCDESYKEKEIQEGAALSQSLCCPLLACSDSCFMSDVQLLSIVTLSLLSAQASLHPRFLYLRLTERTCAAVLFPVYMKEVTSCVSFCGKKTHVSNYTEGSRSSPFMCCLCGWGQRERASQSFCSWKDTSQPQNTHTHARTHTHSPYSCFLFTAQFGPMSALWGVTLWHQEQSMKFLAFLQKPPPFRMDAWCRCTVTTETPPCHTHWGGLCCSDCVSAAWILSSDSHA